MTTLIVDIAMPQRHRPYLVPVVFRRVSNWFWQLFAIEDQRAGRLLLRLVAQYWPWASINVGCLLLAAACEGGTMGLLAIAVSALADDSQHNLLSSLNLETWVSQFAATSGPLGVFLTLIALAVVVQLFRSGLQFLNAVAVADLNGRIDSDLRDELFDSYTRFSHLHFNSYATGELATHTDDCRSAGMVLQKLNAAATQLVLAAASLCVLFWLSVPLTLMAAVFGLVLSKSLRRVMIHIRETSRKHAETRAQLNQQVLEFLTGMRLIRIFARRSYARRRLGRLLEISRQGSRRMLVWEGAVSPIVDTFSILGVVGFLVSGTLLLGPNNPNLISILATFLLVLNRVMPAIRIASNHRATLSTFWPMLVRVASILDSEGKEFEQSGARAFQELNDGIQFRNVSFRYATDQPVVVRNLDFSIGRGQFVALVGKSGSGKSTIADLLLGMFPPTSGEILIDGTPLSQIDLEQWRRVVGVVSQHTDAFNASIRENILFGRLDASGQDLHAAAKRAAADEFIKQLPEAYDTVIGQRGTRLSGGQLQRLAIARALIRDPQLLLLDEATSALDSRSESLIHQSLRTIGKNRTVIAVAHRLSTIAHADLILVFDQGEIVERGTHQQLLDAGGSYARLWLLQSQACSESDAA